jgi:hypothetical protein
MPVYVVTAKFFENGLKQVHSYEVDYSGSAGAAIVHIQDRLHLIPTNADWSVHKAGKPNVWVKYCHGVKEAAAFMERNGLKCNDTQICPNPTGASLSCIVFYSSDEELEPGKDCWSEFHS